jgi:hypothetical protein
MHSAGRSLLWAVRSYRHGDLDLRGERAQRGMPPVDWRNPLPGASRPDGTNHVRAPRRAFSGSREGAISHLPDGQFERAMRQLTLGVEEIIAGRVTIEGLVATTNHPGACCEP